MAESLLLYALGVGDYKASRHWYPNLMLEVDGRKIFVDVPAYLRKMLADHARKGDFNLTFDDYEEVVITHMHGDHVNGLEELAAACLYSSERRVKLYAPRWLLQDVWRMLKPALGVSYRGPSDSDDEETYWPPPGGARPASLEWYFDPIETRGAEGVTDFGDFRLSSMLTRHIPRTLAMKFDFGNFKFGFSADGGFYPALIRFFGDCDLVVHECLFGSASPQGEAFFDAEEVVFSEGDLRSYHTPIGDLLTLPESFQRKTLLHHYRDETYDVTPTEPNYDIGHYRLFEQGKVYRLV